METHLLKEIIECLDDGRRILHYFKDKYALYLLESLFGDNDKITIANIRASQFNKLLNKQVIKQITASCGDGFISREKLVELFLLDYESYVLTLSDWGEKNDYSWVQTSRPGKNLVIQLNFTNEHDEFLSKQMVDGDLFKYYAHPIHEKKSSLAWARIDLDFNSGEALIEEIQSDWLRKVTFHQKLAARVQSRGQDSYFYRGTHYSCKNMIAYSSSILNRYSKLWSETMLFSTIRFIKEELGLSKIFYHTVDTGRHLKNLVWSLPPRSIYTDLPNRFCFEKVSREPEFILSERKIKKRLKKITQSSWFYLKI
ncbi:MAG: hypothetical protein COA74_01185 [Gammaproteobacteria bacterium]|nr:MAG: hypothetical protein COA74_01185 [Gammaproteobacteria bacterium]